jgi:hypothetical protein
MKFIATFIFWLISTFLISGIIQTIFYLCGGDSNFGGILTLSAIISAIIAITSEVTVTDTNEKR